MTRVVFVCQWYPPEPVGVPESIALALQSSGFEVQVLTGIPNFPNGEVVAGYRATRARKDVVNGIRVVRTPLYPSHDDSALRRFANYGSWAASSAVFGGRALRRADVALVYSSPATTAFGPMVAKMLWGTPYVLLIQDLWPDSVFASGFLPGAAGRVAKWILDKFVGLTYRLADHVLVISPGMADLLTTRGVPGEKITLVYNWLPETVGLAPVDATPDSDLRSAFDISKDARVFLYAGNHGRAQGLEVLVRAFKDERTAPGHLVMLGGGVSKSDLVRLADGAPRVHFHDRVPRAEAMRLVASADVHVVSLADRPIFAVTMPSKVQSGLASAQPMMVVSRGDSAELVERHGAGRSAEPGDVASVVDAVVELLAATDDQLTAMGERGRRLYDSEMARDVGVPRLRLSLENAARSRRRTSCPHGKKSSERTSK